ncbi:hypothetical protein WN944_010002 [Citrus x changshan-huyou]|uniref:Uncharacterized protein n=1 Tax=Citrus x changshan-huyou TaxID=2935761 RepID=A0AAP0QSI5_9ROSI
MIDEYAGGFNSRSNDLQEGSDDIVDGDEEDDEDEMGDGGAEDEQGYLDVEEYSHVNYLVLLYIKSVIIDEEEAFWIFQFLR